jgi:hypothetical protein
MQQADPSIADFAPGTAETPETGQVRHRTWRCKRKRLIRSPADSARQYRHVHVSDVVELNLWMDQQAMDEPAEVPREYLRTCGRRQYPRTRQCDGDQC